MDTKSTSLRPTEKTAQRGCEKCARLESINSDLLAACNAVLAWLNSFSMPPTSTIDEKQRTIKIIETAIAKATGQNP